MKSKRILAALIIALLVISLAVPSLSFAASSNNAKLVNASSAPLYKSASAKSAVLAKIPKNASIRVINYKGSGNFLQVVYKSKTGYIEKKYAQMDLSALKRPGVENIPENATTKRSVSVYAAASTSGLKVKTLKADKRVKVLHYNYNKTFAMINYSGKLAFAAKSTLTLDKGVKTGLVPVPVAVKSVKLDKTKLSLDAGKTAKLTATVSPSSATNRKVSFKSSKPAVATVNASTGLIKAIAPGTATITAATDDGGKTAKCVVTVGSSTPAPTPTPPPGQHLPLDSINLRILGTPASAPESMTLSDYEKIPFVSKSMSISSNPINYSGMSLKAIADYYKVDLSKVDNIIFETQAEQSGEMPMITLPVSGVNLDDVYIVTHLDGTALTKDNGGPLRSVVDGGRSNQSVRNVVGIIFQQALPSITIEITKPDGGKVNFTDKDYQDMCGQNKEVFKQMSYKNSLGNIIGPDYRAGIAVKDVLAKYSITSYKSIDLISSDGYRMDAVPYDVANSDEFYLTTRIHNYRLLTSNEGGPVRTFYNSTAYDGTSVYSNKFIAKIVANN